MVRAVLRDAGQPDEPRPVIVATVVNPSGTPVLAGLSARRPALFPAWPGHPAGPAHPLTVTVPRRTARAKFRPAGYATVGVVPASGTVRFPVPVDRPARRYLLTAAIGQADGRLRVSRLRVARLKYGGLRNHGSVLHTYLRCRWAAARDDSYGRWPGKP